MCQKGLILQTYHVKSLRKTASITIYMKKNRIV